MWLLTTDRAELRYFARPPKRYAILSHRWRKHEQTFQDLQAIARRCAGTRTDPRTLLSSKIRKCCAWAAQHGFELVWIDTCCIDKTSSAELSEAVNSMFSWYCLSTICYAYLFDVPVGENPFAAAAAFRRSSWFTRGWTLQELIAPKDVIFLSREWAPLLSKRSHPDFLQEITGVDADVLRGERSLGHVSAAERMSWAAHRRTTRIEDQAYCLMGLFNVKMPTIYGEGRDAFFRLQDEIMKRTLDHSLLVWGDFAYCLPGATLRETEEGDLEVDSGIIPPVHDAAAIKDSCLYAPSPAAFMDGANIRTLPLEELNRLHQIDGRVEVPQISVTNYGIQAMLPSVRLSPLCAVAFVPCQTKDGYTIGILLRSQGDGNPNAVGTCVLPRDKSCAHFDAQGRQLPSCRHLKQVQRYILIPPEDGGSPFPRHDKPKWRTMYFSYRPEHVRVQRGVRPSTSLGLSPRSSKAAFSPIALCHIIFLPPWIIERVSSHGYDLVLPPNERAPTRELREGDQFTLRFAAGREGFDIQMAHHRYALADQGGRVFCTVQFWREGEPRRREDEHGNVLFFGDFIDSWEGQWQLFGGPPSPRAPSMANGATTTATAARSPPQDGQQLQTLRLRFLRMGDLREVEQAQLSNCHVYQIDIMLPRNRFRV